MDRLEETSDDLTTKTANLGQLDRVETRQVRLVVSIPALMFLFTLLLALLAHFNLSEIAEAMPSGERKIELERLAEGFLWFGIGGSFAAGGVGVLLAWQIVRPLRALMLSMRFVAGGDLTQKADVPNLGELGVLGSAFNRMVDQLQELFEQRDRKMRDAAVGTVISLDSEGRVYAADASIKHITGVETESLYGVSLIEALDNTLIYPQNAEFIDRLQQCLDEASRGLTSNSMSEYKRVGRRDPMMISIKISPMEAAGSQNPAYLVDLRDLTSMRSFYEQMQRADRLAAIGTLATGIAHEIRNPLASMRGMAQLLSEDSSDSKVNADYLARMLREIDRLDRLVSSIMDFARAEESPVISVDLNKLLSEAWEIAQPRIEMDPNKTIEVTWELENNLPLCPLEEHRILQALINLISNALEAIKDEGGQIVLATRLLPSTRQRPIVVSIKNTGMPIPNKERERIYEPFYTTKAGGTGLGLPIAYQIITANYGVMELDCAKGMVEFQLRFPIQGRYARLPGNNSTIVAKLP